MKIDWNKFSAKRHAFEIILCLIWLVLFWLRTLRMTKFLYITIQYNTIQYNTVHHGGHHEVPVAVHHELPVPIHHKVYHEVAHPTATVHISQAPYQPPWPPLCRAAAAPRPHLRPVVDGPVSLCRVCRGRWARWRRSTATWWRSLFITSCSITPWVPRLGSPWPYLLLQLLLLTNFYFYETIASFLLT